MVYKPGKKSSKRIGMNLYNRFLISKWDFVVVQLYLKYVTQAVKF